MTGREVNVKREVKMYAHFIGNILTFIFSWSIVSCCDSFISQQLGYGIVGNSIKNINFLGIFLSPTVLWYLNEMLTCSKHILTILEPAICNTPTSKTKIRTSGFGRKGNLKADNFSLDYQFSIKLISLYRVMIILFQNSIKI